MAATNAGRNHIATTLMGSAVTAFDNTNAYIGVGNGADVFAAAQTDLQGASKKRNGMEATYPSRATNILTFRAVFAAGDANFNWLEWGIFNAAAAGTMLCRLVEDNGTKTAAQSWQFTVDITITV